MKRPPDNIARKLLDATDRLPESGGFDISIDEMAAVIGVPRATLYYYFSGKDDLVEFYLNDKLERTAEALEKAAAQEGNPEERLAGILVAIIESLAKYPRMCVELPAAAKGLDSFQSVMANAERWVMASDARGADRRTGVGHVRRARPSNDCCRDDGRARTGRNVPGHLIRRYRRRGHGRGPDSPDPARCQGSLMQRPLAGLAS